jgi:GTP pyrophosphokinase
MNINNNINSNYNSPIEWLKYARPENEAIWESIETKLKNLLESQPDIDSTAINHKSITLIKLLCKLDADNELLTAALLLPYPSEWVKEMVGPDIYSLIHGSKQMDLTDSLEHHNHNQKQYDKLSAMLLAIVDDVRIVVLKLAERLFTLMNAKNAEKNAQQTLARQTMALYAPLANRLGVGELKWQLEDWAFRYLEPEHYQAISKELKQRRVDREAYITLVQNELDHLVRAQNFSSYEIMGRAKHIFSIYRKIQRKQLSFEKIYDAHGFRILLPEVKDCYQLLSDIHSHWTPIQDEFDDYISHPKPNGYQSIHTIIKGPQDRYVEIQIRTYAMNQAAELGIAAHWKYKEGRTQSYEQKYQLLREMMSWQKELGESQSLLDEKFQDLFSDRVYVFTPKNRIIDLPIGSTPLDMAYYLHTELGHHCKGAKVNQKMVPLTHRLRTGDIVEILSHPDHKPSRDWINPNHPYLKSALAIRKVKNWFSRQYREENLEKGQLLFDKICKRENIMPQKCFELIKHFRFKHPDDLIIALGSGNLSTHALIRQLKPDVAPSQQTSATIENKQQQSFNFSSDGLLTQLAKCCQPIPGDPIIGYITTGKGISIHHQQCKNILLAQTRRPERLLDMTWSQQDHRYPVTLYMTCYDHPEWLKEINGVMTHFKISLKSLQSRLDALTQEIKIEMLIEVSHQDDLQQIILQLQQLPFTKMVSRDQSRISL